MLSVCRKLSKRNLLKMVGSVGVIVPLAGCSSGVDGVIVEDVEVTQNSESGYGVEGVVRNVGGEAAGDFLVAAVFYADDVLLDEDWMSINFLRPGESVDFRIPFNAPPDVTWEDVTDYEVELRQV